MSETISIRPLEPADLPAVSALHALVFGPGRFARTAYRVREGAKALSPFCRGAFAADGTMVAALRLTGIAIGEDKDTRGLLLGPLAVAPAYAGLGHGRALIAAALDAAKADGVALVLLVGDEPYYGRFGFKPVPLGQIMLPGPVDPRRLLAAELVPGALGLAHGLVRHA
jgi:predicted N-acetyltransferase YhbS